jgi:hypothetical protein
MSCIVMMRLVDLWRRLKSKLPEMEDKVLRKKVGKTTKLCPSFQGREMNDATFKSIISGGLSYSFELSSLQLCTPLLPAPPL